MVYAFCAFRLFHRTNDKCITSCYSVCGSLITFICLIIAIPMITIDESTTPIINDICAERYDSLPFGTGKILT